MDNAGCHPDNLRVKLSNINVVFLPANTTSKLQPLDLVIIQNFKVHYCHLFLQYGLSRIDEYNKATDVVQSVNILLQSGVWLRLGEKLNLKQCFRMAGVLDTSMEVVIVTNGENCNAIEYLNGNDDLPVCIDLNNDNWEDNVMAPLSSREQDPEETKELEYDSEEAEEMELNVTTYKQAV